MSVIEDLYYGNTPNYDNIKLPKEWHDYGKKVIAQMTKLTGLMSAETYAQVDKLVDLLHEQFTLEKASTYTQSLALGISLGYESKEITKCKE